MKDIGQQTVEVIGLAENNIKNMFAAYLHSDMMKRLTYGILVILGILSLISSNFLSEAVNNFLAGFGISLLIGTIIGFAAGNMIGWPVGLWLGLLGGLFVAPMLSLFFRNAVAAYFSSFFAPLIGAIVGRLSELEDKWKIHERAQKMKADSKKERKSTSEFE